jgi:hypothetical protein
VFWGIADCRQPKVGHVTARPFGQARRRLEIGPQLLLPPIRILQQARFDAASLVVVRHAQ